MNTVIQPCQRCSHCGAPMAPGAREGHCLRCLLQLGMGGEAIEAAAAARDEEVKAGDQIGQYQLLEQIGEGGCGVVFMAEQMEPVRRTVALKLIKLGGDNRQSIARFEAERQALALLDHPNIPKIFDAGVSRSGRHFFVMELVRGVTITEYCDREKLDLRQRLQLFDQVCQAVQHAHQKGLIHRDLKPSNILVTEEASAFRGTPKIIDFGIVKSTEQPLTEKPYFTAFRQFMGTPAYMSPEQASLGNAAMDIRSDIYSLGAVLYELLAGAPPFEPAELLHDDLEEVLRFIRENRPPRPSLRVKRMPAARLGAVAKSRQTDSARLIHLLQGDLDWILLKCLEKDRKRRYETAFGLAADLRQYLQCRPVTARPQGSCYLFQKMIGRHQLAFAATAIALVVLPAATMISFYESTQARNSEREQAVLTGRLQSEYLGAEAEAVKNRQMAAFLRNIFKAANPAIAQGLDTTLLREILDDAARRLKKDLAGQPAAQAELWLALSESYDDLGLYPQMENAAQSALQLSQSISSDDNETVASALTQLGDSLLHQDRLAAAETLERQALEMRIKVLGPQNPAVGLSLNNLGLVLRKKQEWSDAEKLFHTALSLDQKLFGSENPRVAVTLGNLGALLAEQGRLVEAETAYRESLRVRAKNFGTNSLSMAESLENLASVLAREGKLGEAEELNRSALALDKKLLGDKRPEVAAALANLSKLLAAEGRHDEAAELDREARAANQDLAANDPTRATNRLDNLSRRTLAAIQTAPPAASLPVGEAIHAVLETAP